MSDATTLAASTLLQQNKAVLRRRFPSLLSLIESYGDELPASIELRRSRQGLATICVDGEFGKIHVHSSYDPEVEAARWARQPLAESWDSALVIGMGLGYHLESFIAHRPDCRLIVIEPNVDVFFGALAVKDQRKLLSHPGLEIIVMSDPASAAKWFYSLHLPELLSGNRTFVWPATERYAQGFRAQFQEHLTNQLRLARGDLATITRFSLQWVDNFFDNAALSVTDPGVAKLFGRFTNRPAIIVSAGPSLDKNAALLHNAKGRAVIIAAGSAINAMRKHGIEPDLLVSFDPGKYNYRHFKNLTAPSLPLVYVPTIFPAIVQQYDGPRFVAGMEGLPFATWLFEQVGDDKGMLATGPSVANVSWYLATRMGLNPIILVGQDLAYTDMKSHAEGAAHARTVNVRPEQVGQRYLVVEDIHGETVYTSRPMHGMKLSFEELLRQQPEHITIDATEGGVRISGTRIMTLADALAAYCKDAFEPHATILDIHHAEGARLAPSDAKQRLASVFEGLAEQLRIVEDLSDEAIKAGNRLERESTTQLLNEQRYKEAVIRLDRLITRLARLTAFDVFIQPITEHVLTSIRLSIQVRWAKETDLYAQGVGLARQYITLFSTVKDTARHIRRLVLDSYKALM